MVKNTPDFQQQIHGTTAQLGELTGKPGTLAFDLSKKAVVGFDGVKAGGYPAALEARKIQSGTTALKVNGSNVSDLSKDIMLTIDEGALGSPTWDKRVDGPVPTDDAELQEVLADVPHGGLVYFTDDLPATPPGQSQLAAVQAVANEAKAAAAAATTTANSASTTATAAQTAAGNVATAAATAQTTADSAVTAAAAAKTAADTAQTTADGKLGKTETAAAATKLAAAKTIQTNLASTSGASFDGTANVTPGVTGTLPIANGGTGATAAATALSNLGGVAKSGDRGSLAGSETATALSGAQTINVNSADCINLTTSGAVILTFTAAAATVRAIKVISITASAATTLTVSGAVWANNGSAPTWGTAGKILVLIAHFVGGRVVLTVADNTQA